MNTSVIPWANNKQTTEPLLPKLKEPSPAGKDQTVVARPASHPLPCLAKPDTEKSSTTALDLGCL